MRAPSRVAPQPARADASFYPPQSFTTAPYSAPPIRHFAPPPAAAIAFSPPPSGRTLTLFLPARNCQPLNDRPTRDLFPSAHPANRRPASPLPLMQTPQPPTHPQTSPEIQPFPSSTCHRIPIEYSCTASIPFGATRDAPKGVNLVPPSRFELLPLSRNPLPGRHVRGGHSLPSPHTPPASLVSVPGGPPDETSRGCGGCQ